MEDKETKPTLPKGHDEKKVEPKKDDSTKTDKKD